MHDVDGDGDSDLIWGLGHNYGLFWLEQTTTDGQRTWEKHLIDKSWSQPHFMLMADLDNDGKDELVTGKRYYAHNGNDPGENDPRCVYYYNFDAADEEVDSPPDARGRHRRLRDQHRRRWTSTPTATSTWSPPARAGCICSRTCSSD